MTLTSNPNQLCPQPTPTTSPQQEKGAPITRRTLFSHVLWQAQPYSIYSELVSPSDLPAVSGAIAMESTRPKITSPAATSIVGPIPNAARKTGVP